LANLLNKALGVPTAPTETVVSVDPRLGCDRVNGPPVPDLSEPENIDRFKKGLLYYLCTAYDVDVVQVLNKAQKWIAARAPQVKNPAVVLDIDETSLLNWPRIY
jgi:acid phosphatase